MTEASTADLLRYLADSAPWLAHRETEAGPAFDELNAICALLENVVDTREPGSYAGPCDLCGLDMYAKPGKAVVRCSPCNVDYDLAPRRRKLLEKAKSRVATATDCARALTGIGTPVTAERIRKWAERELLRPAGRDRSGHPLYRIRDVLDLLERMPAKAHGSGTSRAS